jgi:site-specific recombinase XerD
MEGLAARKTFPHRFDDRADGDSVLAAERAPGLVRLFSDSNVHVPPIHQPGSYDPTATREVDGTSWLQQVAPCAMVSPSVEIAPSGALGTTGGERGLDVARPDGAEALRKFGEYQRRKNLSAGTISQRRMRIRALGKWLGGDVLDASTEDLEKWLDSCGRGGDGLAPQTRYVYVAALSAFYGWCCKHRYVKKDPTEDLIRPKLPKRQPRPWDEERIAYALTQANPRMRAFLLLAHLAGARCKEMSELRVEDIHVKRGVLMLHGKGEKDRIVPLHPVLYEALVQHGLPRAGYVFRKRDGKPLLPGTISRYVGNFLHSLDNPDTAHMGRHAFGTNFYEISGDILMTAGVMGHESVVTTQIYVEWRPERSAQVVAQLTLPLPGGNLP